MTVLATARTASCDSGALSVVSVLATAAGFPRGVYINAYVVTACEDNIVLNRLPAPSCYIRRRHADHPRII
jgi:hypothetical protein